jgi:starch synthase (maltosyl-transferring)
MLEPTLIYNLFPPLAGPINRWHAHLDRITGLGFTWIYLNPIHTPGLSGSLYAVKDYFGINPRFWPESGQDPQEALREFLAAARSRGLRVMLDLVINHTAIDSPLVSQHPEWYAHHPDGRIKNPGCIDPADATRVTVWGDLAELEYWPVPDPEGLLHYWDQVISHYLRLGFAGFRADAAYKIPGWFWQRLIEEARSLDPQVQFFAETLGCRLEECSQLSAAGFDYLYNSSKWWDFQADWCLEQYEQFRRVAPSVSFPETHDTARVSAESGGDPAVARQRYLFAAFFSTGLMMPVGYEFGFKKPLHVVHTRPEDWEKPTYDLTGFITQVNAMKSRCPVLLTEGPLVRLSGPGAAPVMLLKSREGEPGRVLAAINPTGGGLVVPAASAEAAGCPSPDWQELTPDRDPGSWAQRGELDLAPFEVRLFLHPTAPPLTSKEPFS